MQRALYGVVAILFLNFIGFGIVIPVIPEMIRGASNLEIHYFLLLSLYSLMSFIMAPYWGGLSDRIGRKPVILIGLLGFALSFVLFGISANNLLLMYISRILGGFFSGAATACALAAVTDLTAPESRTKAMGLAGMSIGMGFVIGPAVGASLSLLGHSIPFFTSAILAILNTLYVMKFVPETNTSKEIETTNIKKTSKWSALFGPAKYLFMLSFLVTYTLSSIESTLYYFSLVRFQITPFSFGMMLLAVGLVGALVQGGIVRRVVKPGKEILTAQIGLILCTIGFIALLYSTEYWNATVYLCIFGAGNALIRPCVLSLITQKSGISTGIATGLSSSMDSLGRILGPLISGALFHWYVNGPYLLGGILCLVSLLALYRFVRNEQKIKLHTVESGN